MPAPQPQKKSWFARHKILTGLGVLVILSVIFGGGTSGNGKSNTADNVTGTVNASDNTSASDSSTVSGDATPTPTKAAAPKPKPAGNVIGNWTILTKHPKFGEEYGTFKNVKLDVENTSDSEDQPWLEIRLTKGNRLVTTFTCMGDTVRPGEITTLDCSSTDDYAPWTKYEIKNAV